MIPPMKKLPMFNCTLAKSFSPQSVILDKAILANRLVVKDIICDQCLTHTFLDAVSKRNVLSRLFHVIRFSCICFSNLFER